MWSTFVTSKLSWSFGSAVVFVKWMRDAGSVAQTALFSSVASLHVNTRCRKASHLMHRQFSDFRKPIIQKWCSEVSSCTRYHGLSLMQGMALLIRVVSIFNYLKNCWLYICATALHETPHHSYQELKTRVYANQQRTTNVRISICNREKCSKEKTKLH